MPASLQGNDLQALRPGGRVEVYWPLDEAWYGGKVLSFDPTSKSAEILYDDGDEESVCMAQEMWRWATKGKQVKFFRCPLYGGCTNSVAAGVDRVMG